MQTMERRLTKVDKAEYVKKSDVKLEDKKKFRVLTIFNFVAYILQIIALFACVRLFDITGDVFKFKPSPVDIGVYFIYVQWALVFFFQLFFVVLQLPFMNPG